MSLNVGNAFGRAEQVSLVSMTTFPHWGQSTQLQFTKPYYRNLDNTSVHILSNSYISIFALSIFSLIRSHSLSLSLLYTYVNISHTLSLTHTLSLSLSFTHTLSQSPPVTRHHGHQAHVQRVPAASHGPIRVTPLPVPTRNTHTLLERRLEEHSRIRPQYPDGYSIVCRTLTEIRNLALIGG